MGVCVLMEDLFKSPLGTTLVVQWLIVLLPMQGTGFNPWSGNSDPMCQWATKPMAHNHALHLEKPV